MSITTIPPLTTSNIKPLTAADLSTVGINSGTLGHVYNGTGGAYGIGSPNITWSGTSYQHPQTITLNPNPISNVYTNGAIQNSGTIQVKGDAEFEGKIKVGGKDLVELLSKIEDKLAIYKPNPELEEKWEELRELSKRYKELEAEIKEKEQVWDILKK
jgi:hypothetical protein